MITTLESCLYYTTTISDDEASYHEDASDNGTATNKPKQQQQLIPTTTTISNIKLPILKKEEMEILRREFQLEKMVLLEFSTVSAAESHAVEKERKARPSFLWPSEENWRRFHGMDDAKEIWEAIWTSLVLEAHGAEVSTEDANHKFLRSLPPAWVLRRNYLYSNSSVSAQNLLLCTQPKCSKCSTNRIYHSRTWGTEHKVLFTEIECLVVSPDFKMLDIDYLTDSMNYIPVSLENQTNPHAGTSEVTNSAGYARRSQSLTSLQKGILIEASFDDEEYGP
ncbi:hypothetical protein Tco_0565066 [Tanacetum coccineum]